MKARILVIDDDEMIRSLFKQTLEEEGHAVVTAATSTRTKRKCRQKGRELSVGRTGLEPVTP